MPGINQVVFRLTQRSEFAVRRKTRVVDNCVRPGELVNQGELPFACRKVLRVAFVVYTLEPE
jgi:hypothetical protein